jgi:hypothetical protein
MPSMGGTDYVVRLVTVGDGRHQSLQLGRRFDTELRQNGVCALQHATRGLAAAQGK